MKTPYLIFTENNNYKNTLNMLKKTIISDKDLPKEKLNKINRLFVIEGGVFPKEIINDNDLLIKIDNKDISEEELKGYSIGAVLIVQDLMNDNFFVFTSVDSVCLKKNKVLDPVSLEEAVKKISNDVTTIIQSYEINKIMDNEKEIQEDDYFIDEI